MSLRVWLPLNGDLNNQGLSDVTVTNNGATVDNNGKIGKCYYLNGTSSYIDTGYKTTLGTSDFTISLWLKLPTITSGSYYAICTSKTGGAASVGCGIYWNYTQKKFLWSTADGSGATEIFMATAVDNIVYNKWIHLVMIRNSSDSKLGYFYINGIRYELASVPSIRNIAIGTNMLLGKVSNNFYYVKGYYNDFRIYDHALSAKEVKELSQGLVCHYKFDNIYNTDNLILNGNGELGSKHWSSSSSSAMSTSEIPPNQPLIKASYAAYNTTDYIKINRYNRYAISAYLKTTGSTASTFYPTIMPYDYDKKFISNYGSPDGFNNTYKTTLAQPLKKGDTVIHATDLSAWTTATNYYFHVAIFGYKDSSGFVYPDMQYTADSPAFGTRTDKSHIDKENNTITLNAAFTGEDRPAGTTICQSTEGAGYYYPFGGIAQSSVTDWTLKTASFVPQNVSRLRWARYIRWMAYSGGYYAGNTLVDTTWCDDNIKDDSGNGYNATISGTLLIDSESPRYTYSTRFPLNTSKAYVTFPSVSGFANSYTFSWWSKYTTTGGAMFWGFSNGNRLNIFSYNGTFYWNTGDGTSDPFGTQPYLPDNKFHHYIITGDGTTTNLYIDGEFKANAKTYKGITGTTLYFNGFDSSTSYTFRGCLSDFKLFATALSADDVKRIYNEALSVGKLGDVHPYEIVEDTTNNINKTGVFTNQVFSENYLTEVSKYDNNLYFEPDGAVFIRICHHANTSTTSNLFASSNDFVNGIKKNDNAWANFAIMNDCNSWEFMVKEKYESTDNERVYRWIQPVNPLTAVFADVAAANVTFNPDSRYYDDAFKGGIYKKNSNTYLSQNNGTASSWWGAIGSWTAYNGGIPGFGNNQHVIKTGYMDLYIRIDNQFKNSDNVFKKYKHNNIWYANEFIER